MRARQRDGFLFVMPPGGVIRRFSEHLGTAFLRTMLARSGIPSRQLLPERGMSLAEFAGLLAEVRPRIVGFTAYETNLRACRAMAATVRQTLPEAVVMVGGPNATFSPEETLDLVGADACLRGAGEGTIAGVAGAILGADRPRRRLGDLLAGLPNLAIRTPDGIRRTRAGNLSSFPGGEFRCLDDIPSPYRAGQIATADVGLLTSRGCNQHCSYCSFAAISGHRVHYHGVERILDDIAAFKPVVEWAGRRSVPISDDAFTLAPGRARAICEGIVARGLQMPFECQTRADRVDADLLRLMRRAGFVGVAFGLESAVPRVLRAIGKVRDPAAAGDLGYESERAYLERFRRSVAAAKEAGLEPSVSVIGGLPGETADDFRATLAFVESVGVRTYAHNALALFPGTPLHRDGERHGLRAGRDPASGAWYTRHAYDVRAVRPLRNSQVHAALREEAHEISDALCGVPRPERAGEGSAWAVVIHGGEPDAAVARWLPGVLAVHGALVVVGEGSSGPPEARAWLGALREAEVSWGLFAFLAPDGAPGGTLRSLGTAAEHRFAIGADWHSSGTGLAQDEDGGCRVPVWLAPAAAAPPPADREIGPFEPTPQIADGCRWWSGWRRCRCPGVLHVWPDFTVRPCWRGPAMGTVGDAYAELLARSRGSGPDGEGPAAVDRCSLASGAPIHAEAMAAEAYEVAAQMAWEAWAVADWSGSAGGGEDPCKGHGMSRITGS